MDFRNDDDLNIQVSKSGGDFVVGFEDQNGNYTGIILNEEQFTNLAMKIASVKKRFIPFS